MTGRQRIVKVLAGRPVDRPPVLPMIHAGLAGHFNVSLGRFFTRPEVMARVMIEGYRRFRFDGVQLSLGVTGEAEALGAAVEQPPDAAPVLKQHLLADPADLDALRSRYPAAAGRMPLFFAAVDEVVREIGQEAFVLATLRGPLLIASQLRGVEDVLIDMIERPRVVGQILEFAAEVASKLAQVLLGTGAHGLLLGEATCSPNFISPAMYRQLVLSHHSRLVGRLKQMGWPCVGLHVCGNITPIVEDMISTGIDFMDVDYQVPADRAIALAQHRVALRGNLDPSSVLRFGTVDEVRSQTRAVCRSAGQARWIMSSGCDIPPDTPAENLAAFVDAVHATHEPGGKSPGTPHLC